MAQHPVLGLRIVAGRLELRGLTDSDLPALGALAEAGVHPREQMPFASAWTEAPAGELADRMTAYHQGLRATFCPDEWSMQLGVWQDGVLVGVQGLRASGYLGSRSARTGSWLGLRFQGRGIGTRMRRVICAFAFDHLDAAVVRSGAFTDNPASIAVSRKAGYREARVVRTRRRGETVTYQRMVLEPADLVRDADEPVVHGVAAVRAAIGLPVRQGD